MEEMLAYEFYYQNQNDQQRLIGILPERRKDHQRITPDSILNWAKVVLGEGWDMERVSFIRVIVKKRTGEMVEFKPDKKGFGET